ncbi:hypothetical protein AYO41_03385 [Verrucomicrobia bacterium SCGC AG-212-E04]|nr:hypothetical protein AYO41_03385 [Verrucomicrobia bacterium SCGC AG-212-E04]
MDIGRYRILRQPDGSPWRLGSGAMGVTYKAFDDGLQVDVALKVIAPARLDDPRARALFLREARAAARVRHENVATVVYLSDGPESFFLVMEFVPGESLEAWLRAQDVLPPLLATDFAIQIARGLGAIHAQQIVHRDLKPANLMIVPAGAGGASPVRGDPAEWRVKIIDFGLARAFAATGLETQAGASTMGFVGTATYASPEQCAESSEIDGRADLYALGCILWEMLTGAPPFRGTSQLQLINQHLTQLVPLARITYLPPSLVAVLARLLAKDPEFRYADAAAAAAALEQCRERLAGGAEGIDEDRRVALRADPLDPPAGAISSSAAGAPRLGSLLPLLGAAVALALAVGAWFLWRSVDAPPAAPASRTAKARPDEPRPIAVLPFATLGADRETEEFASALRVDLQASLARIQTFKVVPSALNADQIAQLQGTVRRAGGRVRVTVQLMDPATGQNLWADTFDTGMDASGELPDRIARALSAALALEPAQR